MKVTVTGSLGNISRILVEKLVSAGHEVKLISSNADRAEEIEGMKAIPLIGSLEDQEFVTRTFTGSEAVYLMIPPSFQSPDLKQYIRNMGQLYARAIAATGVRYIVNLSSIGAHLENGSGPTGANFHVEQTLNALPGVDILHLRPGMFLTNFYGAIPMIRQQHIVGNNFAGTVELPLTHPKDIAEAAFNALDQRTITGKQVRYIVSDEKNGSQIAQVLGNAIGNPDLPWVEFSDEQLLGALVQSGFSEQMAKVYMVEMGQALRNGSFMEDYILNRAQAVGGTALQEFAREFAFAYHQGS